MEVPDRDFTRGLGELAFDVPDFCDGVLAGQVAACDVSDERRSFSPARTAGRMRSADTPRTQNIDGSLASLQLACPGGSAAASAMHTSP